MASTMLPSTRPERALALQWVVATTVGWAVGFFVCETLKAFFESFSHSDGLVIGAGIGIAQGFVLRRRIAPMGWWILVSTIGFGVGKAIGESATQGLAGGLGYALAGAVIGLVVGMGQWLVLRRRVSHPEWWVLANVAAWAVGWSVISLGATSTPMLYVVGGLGAAIAGIITAVTLIWLARTRPA
ncbi:MAG: hypothetical protein M3R32_00790 [Chloroflexota bacterium]|nr:hypothetical protein [Chloroflexota bacterium]